MTRKANKTTEACELWFSHIKLKILVTKKLKVNVNGNGNLMLNTGSACAVT